jgi:hypothetical protein
VFVGFSGRDSQGEKTGFGCHWLYGAYVEPIQFILWIKFHLEY